MPSGNLSLLSFGMNYDDPKYLQVVGVVENSRDAPKALLAYICHELVNMKRPNMDLEPPQSCISPTIDSELP